MRENVTGMIHIKIYLYICWHIGISNTFNSWHWGTSVWSFQIMPSYEYSLKGQPVRTLCGHNDSDRRSVADLRGMCINVNANHSKLVYNIGLNHLFIDYYYMKNMYSLKPAADFTATDKRLPDLYIYIRLYTFYIILSFISCFIFIYFYVYVFMKAYFHHNKNKLFCDNS